MIEHSAIEGLPEGCEAINIVSQQVLKVSSRILPNHINDRHVGDVKNAGSLAYCCVLVDL